MEICLNPEIITIVTDAKIETAKTGLFLSTKAIITFILLCLHAYYIRSVLILVLEDSEVVLIMLSSFWATYADVQHL